MRTVRDSARVFTVIAGIDPADPATEIYRNHKVDDYTANLSTNGLSGARLGVLRQIYDANTADKQVLAVFDRALTALELAGASPSPISTNSLKRQVSAGDFDTILTTT
jgi:Asp-tRNA(Asn)/Glu-tRNA(Gln) amidotransferase A subunit family amidase